jgi:CheY-like chemotaxis protein
MCPFYLGGFMENLSQLIDSIATIMWPTIVIIILLSFRKNIQALIKSGESRKFSVKIGDMEVNMDELSKQQGEMIKDLQARINTMQKEMETLKQPVQEAKAEPDSPTTGEVVSDAGATSFDIGVDTDPFDDDISSILWVDDNPVNNAFLIDSLTYQGVQVTTAHSTQDGLDHFNRGSFNCIITDVNRLEGGMVANKQAGFELIRAIREEDDELPIYIYTGKVDEKMRQKAKNLGATGVTSSPSELLQMLGD